jgi:hypothetical protein
MKNVFAVLPKYIMWMIFLASLLWQNTFSQTLLADTGSTRIHPLTGDLFIICGPTKKCQDIQMG